MKLTRRWPRIRKYVTRKNFFWIGKGASLCSKPSPEKNETTPCSEIRKWHLLKTPAVELGPKWKFIGVKWLLIGKFYLEIRNWRFRQLWEKPGVAAQISTSSKYAPNWSMASSGSKNVPAPKKMFKALKTWNRQRQQALSAGSLHVHEVKVI